MSRRHVCSECEVPLTCNCCGMHPHEPYCELRQGLCESCAMTLEQLAATTAIDWTDECTEPGTIDYLPGLGSAGDHDRGRASTHPLPDDPWGPAPAPDPDPPF